MSQRVKPGYLQFYSLSFLSAIIITSIIQLFALDVSAIAAPQGQQRQTAELNSNVDRSRCIVCHNHDHLVAGGVDNDTLKAKCQSCHVQKMETSLSELPPIGNTQPEMTLASGDDAILQLKQQLTHPEKKLDSQAGMQFPLYSKESRLGDAPNKMVLVPGGTFIMGSNDRLPDEGPRHSVSLNSYYIDIYEVTNLQYKKFNDETRRRSPSHFRNRTFPEGKADHPVTYVSWEDANAYCIWAGKRLPSDQEWEKAARGEDGRIFPWGNEFDPLKANTPLRWQQVGAFGDTTPVGAFKDGASPYGVYDMSGNVWEWTASWYKAYPGNKVASESYGERYKTLKGGSWFDCSFYNCGISAPVFNRAFFSVHTKNDSFGFRCAKDGD